MFTEGSRRDDNFDNVDDKDKDLGSSCSEITGCSESIFPSVQSFDDLLWSIFEVYSIYRLSIVSAVNDSGISLYL